MMKTTYCERCGVCEAECPTGALIIRKNRFEINPLTCVHCHNCYNVNSYGCIVGSRRRVSEGGTAMSAKTRTSGIDKYSTFGLKDDWFNCIMDMGDEWFENYPGLGPKMIPAAINWFRDAKIVDAKEKKISDFGKLLQSIYKKNVFVAWQLLWINLCFNSQAVNCYVTDLINLVEYKKQDIITAMQYRYPSLSEATLGNPTGALFNMFSNAPRLGCNNQDVDFVDNYSIKMGVVNDESKEKTLKKVGSNNISKMAIAYLLYLIAEKENRYIFSVSELYENKEFLGPEVVFNYDIEKFMTMLRALTEDGILNAELLGGLDNIKLNSGFTSTNVLKLLLEKM